MTSASQPLQLIHGFFMIALVLMVSEVFSDVWIGVPDDSLVPEAGGRSQRMKGTDIGRIGSVQSTEPRERYLMTRNGVPRTDPLLPF